MATSNELIKTLMDLDEEQLTKVMGFAISKAKNEGFIAGKEDENPADGEKKEKDPEPEKEDEKIEKQEDEEEEDGDDAADDEEVEKADGNTSSGGRPRSRLRRPNASSARLRGAPLSIGKAADAEEGSPEKEASELDEEDAAEKEEKKVAKPPAKKDEKIEKDDEDDAEEEEDVEKKTRHDMAGMKKADDEKESDDDEEPDDDEDDMEKVQWTRHVGGDAKTVIDPGNKAHASVQGKTAPTRESFADKPLPKASKEQTSPEGNGTQDDGQKVSAAMTKLSQMIRKELEAVVPLVAAQVVESMTSQNNKMAKANTNRFAEIVDQLELMQKTLEAIAASPDDGRLPLRELSVLDIAKRGEGDTSAIAKMFNETTDPLLRAKLGEVLARNEMTNIYGGR